MRALAIALVVLAGCYDDDHFPPTDQIVAITACPAAEAPCGSAADGATLRAYRFCTAAASPRASSLPLTATASSGTWLGVGGATPGTFTADLSATGCADALYQPGTLPGPVRIAARLVSVETTSDFVLGAAELGSIDVSPAPASLESTGSTTVTLAATVRGVGQGRPSQGTLVAFEIVSVVPSGAFATLVPSSAGQPISASDAASAQLVASGATSVTVRVTATPPAVPGAPEPAPQAVSRDVTIAVLP